MTWIKRLLWASAEVANAIQRIYFGFGVLDLMWANAVRRHRWAHLHARLDLICDRSQEERRS